ncbi:MAG: hypothetical protein ACM3X7_12125 [Solirubrobacterales bacterium]
MKRILKIPLAFIAAIFLIFVFQMLPKDNKIQIKSNSENRNAELMFKGLENARDFTMDEQGNYYIAFKNKVQIISPTGKSYVLFQMPNINIFSICSDKNKLYYSSDNKIFYFDLNSRQNTEIINDLPNYGDYNQSILKINGENLFITIGAATNSGVVGNDNIWKENNPYFHDIMPILITLKGMNFGTEKTGAFQSYKTSSSKGQIVSPHFPGNASILKYNIKTGERDTFASGIRNIKGMDFTTEGKVAATVGGMENRGLRPILGDSDYIYEIEKGIWYGWPDYSGGDPIDCPRFKGKNGSKLNTVLENHPNTNPPGPRYQSNSVDELGELAVDRAGIIGDKNTIYFYKKGNIYSLDKKNIVKEEFILPGSNNCRIKFYNNCLIILDNKGNIFSIKSI